MLSFETRINNEITELILELREGSQAPSQPLFAIANEMTGNGRRLYPRTLAAAITKAGASRMVAFEDVDAYESLEKNLLPLEANSEFTGRLPWVFELEVDSLLQQSEPGIVKYQVGDFQRRSKKYGVPIALDALYAHLVAVHARSHAVPLKMIKIERDHSLDEVHNFGNEDDEVVRLLSTLKASAS